MKNVLYIFLAFSLSFCKSPKIGVVSNEAMAIMKTEDTLKKVMDIEEFESIRPFKAKLTDSDKIWEVKPVDIAEFAGLIPIVFIDKESGKILKILWGEGSID